MKSGLLLAGLLLFEITWLWLGCVTRWYSWRLTEDRSGMWSIQYRAPLHTWQTLGEEGCWVWEPHEFISRTEAATFLVNYLEQHRHPYAQLIEVRPEHQVPWPFDRRKS